MESQNKSVVVSWIIPSMILMIVVVIMLFNFSTKSSADASESVSRNLIKSTQGYGEDFLHELDMLNKVASPVRVLLEKEDTWDQEYITNMTEILAACTDADQVVFCDSTGRGISHLREEVSVAEEAYFKSIQESDSVPYVYSDGRIIVIERVNGTRESGYLLLFYPMEKFSQLMSKSDFDSNTFLVVVNSEGEILGLSGTDNSKMLKDGNLLNAIESENMEAVRTIRNRLSNGSRGTSSVTVGDESRMLVYVPLGVNQWEMILGVRQDYVDKQVGLQWQNTKSMLTYLILAIFIFICMVMIINIISKIRTNNKKKELENKADTDLLTGLTNKLATERKIKEFMAQNPNSQSMMFMVDIDNFKKINDTMGHAFGDEVLRSLGQQIGALFRATDIIGRVGGDEFMIFLKGVNEPESVRKEAKKVEHFFNNFQAGEYVKYAATASIGVAVFPHEGADFETLYKAADQGVYKAKKRGKNQLAFYRDEWAEPKSE